MGVKYTYVEVKNKLKELGYILLSETYINMHTKLKITNEMGYLFFTTLNGLLYGKIPSPFALINPYIVDNLNHYIFVNGDKSKVLKVERDRGVLFCTTECSCGEIYSCSITHLIDRKQFNCNKCSFKKRGLKKRNAINDVKNLFIANNLIPLFTEYNGCFERLLCEDECGYKGLLSYGHLKSGSKFDLVGKYNPYSIYNVKNYIKLNSLKCEIIDDVFKNSNYPINLKCECGTIYQTIWRTFMTYHNDRCPRCSKKQSKYAYEVEQFLINNKINYNKEHTFKDCRDINVLPFDFIIFNKYSYFLLEVDGETHFTPAWTGEKGFKKQLMRDEIKNNYCIDNKINLIRVSYKEVLDGSYKDKITKELN